VLSIHMGWASGLLPLVLFVLDGAYAPSCRECSSCTTGVQNTCGTGGEACNFMSTCGSCAQDSDCPADGTSYSLTFSATLSGDLADYTDSQTYAIKEVVADELTSVGSGCTESDISVTVAAGSVNVAVTIAVASNYDGTAKKTALDAGILASESAFQTALGNNPTLAALSITVTAVTAGTISMEVAAAASSFSTSSARKDPHIRFADGGRADFRGEHNKIFNFLSARNVSLNIKTVAADFKWIGHLANRTISDPGFPRVVHGTKMEAAYWTVRTTAGRRLHATYSASSPETAKLETSETTVVEDPGCQLTFLKTKRACMRTETKWTTTILQPSDEVEYDNVKVSLQMTAKEKRLNVVIKDRWDLSAQTNLFPFANVNPGQSLLDVQAKALYDADHDVVAPHGLFGQSFDGDELAVTGKLDPRPNDEATTEAQAEGAIEGVWRDYMIKCDPTASTTHDGVRCEHATQFKFSRFDKTSAKPRDVTKLSGIKKKRVSPDVAAARIARAQEALAELE